MEWAVVFFTKDRTYSEIPVSWLTTDCTQCWWPKTLNATQYMTRGEIPDKGKWLQYDVIVETYCKTFEGARKRAEHSDYSSTQEKDTGKGKRLKKNKKYDYSSDEQSDELTPPPTPKSNEETLFNSQQLVNICPSSNSNLINEKVRPNSEHPENNIIENEIIIIASGDPPHFTENDELLTARVHDKSEEALTYPSVNLLQEESVENHYPADILANPSLPNVHALLVRLTTVCCSIEKHLKDMSQNMHSMRLAEGDKATDNFMNEIRQRLPLKSIEEMIEFEDNLKKSSSLRKTLISYLKSIGGKDLKDNGNRCLGAIITNELGVQCSWFGQRGNIRVADLTLMSIIVDILVCQYAPFHAKICDVQKNINEWFRLSKQRLQRKN